MFFLSSTRQLIILGRIKLLEPLLLLLRLSLPLPSLQSPPSSSSPICIPDNFFFATLVFSRRMARGCRVRSTKFREGRSGAFHDGVDERALILLEPHRLFRLSLALILLVVAKAGVLQLNHALLRGFNDIINHFLGWSCEADHLWSVKISSKNCL